MYVDNVVSEDYIWFTNSIIRFDEAPDAGATIVITRTPPVDDPLNTFTGGTVITPTGLRENFRQSLQITERSLWGDRSDTAVRLESGATINGILFTGEEDITIYSSRLEPGATINGILFDGEEDITIFPSGNLGEFAQESVTINVDPNQTVVSSITLPIKVHVVAMTSTAPCWLRVYSNPAALAADAARLRTMPPTRGIGVVADPVFTEAQTIFWDPTETFVNRQDPPSTVYPLRIQNDSPSATSITITVDYYFF